VLADARVALPVLDLAIGPDPQARDQRPDVAARQAIWRAEKARRALDDRGNGLPAAAVFDVLSRLAPADAVLAVDVGNHAYSFGRYLESKGQPVLLDNGSLGKIGKEQRAGQFPEWHVSLTNPNFAEYAVLCGAQGETVRTRAELQVGMARMLAASGPYLLHIVQDGELV
jgi:pyruvate oxidase